MNSLTTEADKLSVDLQPDTTSTSPLVCLLPEYAETRIACLRELESLARTGLSKSINQLDRLIQLYTEINEARQWISKGNSLNSPLTPEHVAEMDPAACAETIKQLSAFCELREANLVLKGNPGQFRKQFSDLLNAEMKVCVTCLRFILMSKMQKSTSLYTLGVFCTAAADVFLDAVAA